MDPLLIVAVGIAAVVIGILWLRLHAVLALLGAALLVAALTPQAALQQFARNEALREVQQKRIVPEALEQRASSIATRSIGRRLADGFGRMAGDIAIVIAMASIIGKCLLDSGSADRIVRSMLRLVGQGRAAAAFVGSGFVLGIPVFFDTVFYLLIPLGKAMRVRTGGNYLLYVLTIVAGATMAHSLVPPTPGPLAVAAQLNVGLGRMILAGCVVGLFTSALGYAYAHWANRRWQIPLRDSADVSLAELERLTERDERQLPPLWLALAPIVLPVALIAGNELLRSLAKSSGRELAEWEAVVVALGDKNVALLVAAAVALATLAWQRRATRGELAASVQAALASGGVIVLITASGGAFGAALQETAVAERIRDMAGPADSALVLIPLSFLVTTTIRTAQGSATVAMITAGALVSQLIEGTPLTYDPVYIALAIGCGSKPIAWMNDSGFWVIGKMSGMTEAETLKTVTPMTAMMGVAGLGVVMLGAVLMPMAGGSG